MNKPGIAILGLDHWYAAFSLADEAANNDQVRLVAVADDYEARAQQTARRYGAEIATTDNRTVLDRDDVDIVIAMYSTDRNVAVCRDAANAGKHIVSVKPVAMDLTGADAIIEAVRAAGVHFFPYESVYRLAPGMQRVKGWIDEGRIGQPLRYMQTLHSSLPRAWHESTSSGWWLDPAAGTAVVQNTPPIPDNTDSGWWVNPARVPGGGWLDHAIYAVDMARWFFGAEPASVQGVVANRRHPELPLEDYGFATYTLANGVVATIEDTWTAERGFFFNHSEIIGSAGAIRDETRTTGRMLLRGDFGFDGWTALEQQGPGPSKIIDHMLACIAGTSAPVATVTDARANLAACLAFYRAAGSGTAVQIEQA